MDRSSHSSGDSTITSATSSSSSSNNNNNSNTDQYLRHLNKISHKISKPVRRPAFDDHHPMHQPPPLPRPPPPQPQSQSQSQPQPQSLQQQQQHQPPVYNINKSDFRDVVQKLTGSPAHERFSTPPPIQPPKPPSSRLQRIRPPPLAQISNRPPPLLNNAVPPQPLPGAGIINPNIPINTAATAAVGNSGNFGSSQRPLAPLSPLPPFPAVHASAESPISAYMRYLQTSVSTVDSDPKRFSGLSPLAPLVSPRWNNFAQPQPPQSQHQPLPPLQHNVLPSPTSAFMAQSHCFMPTSPLPFGCLPSPRSPYPLLSPSLLFSPSTTGQLAFQQFPVSPRLPVPSPRWKDR